MNKILIVTLEYPPQIGGIASYTHNFARSLPAGQAVIYAPKIKDDRAFDKASGLKVYRCRPYWLVWPLWGRLVWQLRRICRREKISELHVHHAQPAGYAAYLIGRTLKLPYTLFLHGADLEMGFKNRWKRFWFKWVCRHARRLVVNSQFLKTKLLARLENEISASQVSVLYPCPAEEFYSAPVDNVKVGDLKAKLGLEGKKVMLSVSRLAQRKGHVLLARYFPEILRRVPNAVWLIVGDGPEREKLLTVVTKLNLTGAVRFLPALPVAELIHYYDVADLFVLLTHRDGDGVDESWGIVFLEAAARGLPVLAGQSGGVGEAVKHLETGVVVDAYQKEAVVSSVVDLLNNVAYARQLGAAGRERARQEFRWGRQVLKVNVGDVGIV